MATHAQRLLTVEEFLRIDFGPDLKAELDRGVIRMMAGGTRNHSRVQANILRFLVDALEGSPCEPFGSDMAVRTAFRSIRYPDVSIDCSDDEGDERLLHTPKAVIEILSPSTRDDDLGVKLDEYRALATLRTIVIVDVDTRDICTLRRGAAGSWPDVAWSPGAAIDLPEFGCTIPHDTVFARVT